MKQRHWTSKIFPKIFLIATIATLLASISTGWAAPKPALVAATGDWQLDIEIHGDPKLLSLMLPGDEMIKNYWYLTYTVTNNTGQDVDYFPEIELFTDTFKSTVSGKNVRDQVFQKIRNRYRHTIPLLESQDQVTEKILQGRDNSRDSVAIFEDFDLNARTVKLFLSGTSNEVATVKHPLLIDGATKKPKDVLLKKTLMLEYRISGDQHNPEQRVMLYRDRSWIMR